MNLRILWVGKTREEWVKKGVDEYFGRIRRYFPCEILEAREEKGGDPATMREKESGRLEKLLDPRGMTVILDETGEELSSREFSALLSRCRDTAVPSVTFVIGGAYGFSDAFRSRGTKKIALSRMTFPHQMVRIILTEQVYRACTIMNGEPYHH